MNKPTQLEMIRHLSEHYGLQFSEVAAIMKVPTHPSRMRDEFAALALQGMLANSRVTGGFAELAESAYMQADAMLTERIKQK